MLKIDGNSSGFNVDVVLIFFTGLSLRGFTDGIDVSKRGPLEVSSDATRCCLRSEHLADPFKYTYSCRKRED